jgi:hypothetical protein
MDWRIATSPKANIVAGPERDASLYKMNPFVELCGFAANAAPV